MVATLAALDAGCARPRPQRDEAATYAAKIDKAEAEIDWSRPAAELDRHIRGLSPAPGAWTEIAGERVRVLACRPETAQGPSGATPGTALDDALLIACGTGALRLLRLQRPGRAETAAADFLRGFAVPAGSRLG
jgi:methionyl-tRNA formyltransferase